MAYETRATFENRLRQSLGNYYPVPDVSQIMNLVSESLRSFELTWREDSPKEPDDLLSVYLNALKIQGRSDKTIVRYRYALGRMLKSVKVHTTEITIHHLRGYLTAEKNRGISDETLEGNRQVYSAYFNWLQREGLITGNPTANLGSIKRKKKLKTAFTDIDIELMKRHCKTIRDRAIVLFLLSTACRVSEMTQLNIDDVDLVNLECTVLGKGNKERTVYLDSVSGSVLREYLRSRTDSNEALFVDLKGDHERLTAGGVRAMLTRLGASSGVNHVHPHKFRRTKATNLIKHGMSIQEVAAILGHEKLDTTMKYVVMDQTAIRNAYHKYA